MANCILAYPDRLLGATLGGLGSWLETMPLNNLKNQFRYMTARSTSASLFHTRFDFDLGQTRDLRVFSIPWHNFSRDATIDLLFSDGADYSHVLYNPVGLRVWPQYYEPGALPWGHPQLWSGYLSQEAAETIQPGFYHCVPDDLLLQARYGRVQIYDPDNPAGYVELSRFFTAPGWSPPDNMNFGLQFGLQEHWDAAGNPAPQRFCNFTISNLTEGQAMAYPWEMQRALMTFGEMFFVFDPEDVYLSLMQRSFLAKMRELSPIEYPSFDSNSASFRLEEILYGGELEWKGAA